MLPTAPDGARVIVLKLPRWLIRRGMLVIVEAKPDVFILKRVASIVNNKQLQLSSDNPDTQTLYCDTPIDKSFVVGVGLWIFKAA